jgi:hypothetical protein
MDQGRKQDGQHSSNGPIKEGSPLHRAIDLIAREVARKLVKVTEKGARLSQKTLGQNSI